MSEHTKARTERLLAMTHGQLVLHAQDLTRQRDELLAALERSDKYIDAPCLDDRRSVIDQNRAAIASVKGDPLDDLAKLSEELGGY